METSNWEVDANVTSCPLCKKGFSFFRRRHHCRECGKIICNNCSTKTALTRNCHTCILPVPKGRRKKFKKVETTTKKEDDEKNDPNESGWAAVGKGKDTITRDIAESSDRSQAGRDKDATSLWAVVGRASETSGNASGWGAVGRTTEGTGRPTDSGWGAVGRNTETAVKRTSGTGWGAVGKRNTYGGYGGGGNRWDPQEVDFNVDLEDGYVKCTEGFGSKDKRTIPVVADRNQQLLDTARGKGGDVKIQKPGRERADFFDDLFQDQAPSQLKTVSGYRTERTFPVEEEKMVSRDYSLDQARASNVIQHPTGSVEKESRVETISSPGLETNTMLVEKMNGLEDEIRALKDLIVSSAATQRMDQEAYYKQVIVYREESSVGKQGGDSDQVRELEKTLAALRSQSSNPRDALMSSEDPYRQWGDVQEEPVNRWASHKGARTATTNSIKKVKDPIDDLFGKEAGGTFYAGADSEEESKPPYHENVGDSDEETGSFISSMRNKSASRTTSGKEQRTVRKTSKQQTKKSRKEQKSKVEACKKDPLDDLFADDVKEEMHSLYGPTDVITKYNKSSKDRAEDRDSVDSDEEFQLALKSKMGNKKSQPADGPAQSAHRDDAAAGSSSASNMEYNFGNKKSIHKKQKSKRFSKKDLLDDLFADEKVGPADGRQYTTSSKDRAESIDSEEEFQLALKNKSQKKENKKIQHADGPSSARADATAESAHGDEAATVPPPASSYVEKEEMKTPLINLEAKMPASQSRLKRNPIDDLFGEEEGSLGVFYTGAGSEEELDEEIPSRDVVASDEEVDIFAKKLKSDNKTSSVGPIKIESSIMQEVEDKSSTSNSTTSVIPTMDSDQVVIGLEADSRLQQRSKKTTPIASVNKKLELKVPDQVQVSFSQEGTTFVDEIASEITDNPIPSMPVPLQKSNAIPLDFSVVEENAPLKMVASPRKNESEKDPPMESNSEYAQNWEALQQEEKMRKAKLAKKRQQAKTGLGSRKNKGARNKSAETPTVSQSKSKSSKSKTRRASKEDVPRIKEDRSMKTKSMSKESKQASVQSEDIALPHSSSDQQKSRTISVAVLDKKNGSKDTPRGNEQLGEIETKKRDFRSALENKLGHKAAPLLQKREKVEPLIIVSSSNGPLEHSAVLSRPMNRVGRRLPNRRPPP